jgi:hypothetical protein
MKLVYLGEGRGSVAVEAVALLRGIPPSEDHRGVGHTPSDKGGREPWRKR